MILKDGWILVLVKYFYYIVTNLAGNSPNDLVKTGKKTKKQNTIFVGHHCTQTNTNNVNKT
jgi:hypothetical protein